MQQAVARMPSLQLLRVKNGCKIVMQAFISKLVTALDFFLSNLASVYHKFLRAFYQMLG